MMELSKQDKNHIMIHKYHESTELSHLKPYQRDILLFETHVAGTSHIKGIEALVDEIKVGDLLTFFRDSQNAYDNHAVEVRNATNQKIGFIPKGDNLIFARLMDAGKLLYGKVSAKELQGRWLKIDMEIYLRDI